MPDERKNEHVENPDVRYELKDASLRQVIVAGVGLAVATVLSCFAMYLLFNLLKHGDLIAQKGLPVRAPGAQAATAPMPGARQGQPQAVPRNSASPGAPIMKQQEGRQ